MKWRLGKPVIAAAIAIAAPLVVALNQPLLLADLTAAGKTPGQDSKTGYIQAERDLGNGVILYLDADSANRISLWRWDASAGRQLVRSLRINSYGYPGSLFPRFDSTPPAYIPPRDAAVVGGIYYFTGSDGDSLGGNDDVTGNELWRSDGTPDGTYPVADLWPGRKGSNPVDLVAFNGALYFLALSPDDQGRETPSLWRSDGTEAGTRIVYSLPADGPYGGLTVGGERLYFVAGSLNPYFREKSLWSSDGSTANTNPVINYPSSTTQISRGAVLPATGRYYFCSDGRYLASTNGVYGDVTYVKDFAAVQGGCSVSRMLRVGNRLLFSARSDHRAGYWTSDGTEAGTQRVVDGNPGDQPPVVIGSRAAFRLYNLSESGYYDIFGYDDTTHSVEQLKRVDTSRSYLGSELYPYLAAKNGRFYFFQPNAQDPSPGLWQSDGTAAGTAFASSDASQYASIAGPSALTPPLPMLQISDLGSKVGKFLALDEAAFFQTNAYPLTSTYSVTAGLAVTDGTPEYTSAFRGAYLYGAVTPFKDGLLAASYQLIQWIDQGGEARNVYRDSNFTGAQGAVRLNAGQVLFMHQTTDYYYGSTDQKLWISDATQAGTHALDDGVSFGNRIQRLPLSTDSDANPVSDPAYNTEIFRVVAGKALFFVYSSDQQAYELWVADGSASGTQKLSNLGLSAPRFLGVLGDKLFFVTSGYYGDRNLYVSDGTAQGTTRLAVGSFSDNSLALQDSTDLPEGVAFKDRFYFRFGQSTEGYELWSSDGSSAGTQRLIDIRPGAASSYPRRFTAAGDVLLFSAVDAAGEELWKSDGTAGGTIRVADISPGASSSQPASLAYVAESGKTYFRATTAAQGTELWETDGTAANTRLTLDINPGPASSTPTALALMNGRLLFAADDGVTGAEPRAITVGTIKPTTPRVKVEDAVLSERDGENNVVRLTLNRASDRPVSVDYQSTFTPPAPFPSPGPWQMDFPRNAHEGSDYQAFSGTATFGPGQTEIELSVQVTNDNQQEGDETFAVQIGNAVNGFVGRASAVITIHDDGNGASKSMIIFMPNGQIVQIETDAGLIEAARFDAPPEDAPGDYAYPYGFLSVDIGSLEPGQAAHLRITLPQDASPELFVKCMPSGCAPYANAQIEGNVVSFTLVDGGAGDSDGIANGQIADPGAPAVAGQIDPFSFLERSKVAQGKFITSETIQITGNGEGVHEPLSISNGQYSLNGGHWTNAEGVLTAGDSLRVRHVSSSSPSTATVSTITVAEFSTQFRSVTDAVDRVPDAFSFASQNGVVGGSPVTSNAIVPSGFDVEVPVTAGTGQSYSINGAAFTSAKGSLKPGDSIRVQHVANSQKSGYTKSTLTIGGVSGSFTTRSK